MKCSEHRGTPGEGPSLITARQALTLLLVSTRVHQVHTCHTPDVLLDVRLIDISRSPLRGPGDQQSFTSLRLPRGRLPLFYTISTLRPFCSTYPTDENQLTPGRNHGLGKSTRRVFHIIWMAG